MIYPFRFCLMLFFLFSIFCHLPCSSSKHGLGWCEALFECGNITAGFPFWGGSLRPKPCGHPLLELRCLKNITSLNISNHEYNVFSINQTSLSLARKDLLGSFCSATFKTTTFPPEIFELSPTYKSFTVLYHCDPKLSYHSSYTCPDLGLFSVSQSLDYQNSCQNSFTVSVPATFVPEERKLNLTRFENVLKEGFEVKLVVDDKPCHECSSSNGICGFNSTTQICCNITSPSGGCVPQHQPSVVDLYSLCRTTFSCGDHVDIKYPFWIPGREACGHPDFKLNCSGGFAEVNISTVKFRVIDTMRFYYGITLVRSDYIGDLFPPNPKNVKFNEKVVYFPSYTELLTIYYDCPNFSPLRSGSSYVGELGSADDKRNYYVTKDLTSHSLDGIIGILNNFREMCKRNVSIPASGSALETLQRSPSEYNLQKALEQGFDLYLQTDCSSCMYTGGTCGYNQTSSVFVCYCKDGPHNSSCSSHHDPSDTGWIIVDVAIYFLVALGSLAVIIACVGLLCPCFRVKIFRKRKTSDDRRREKLKALIPLKHYTYAQVKKMTNSFAEVVGRGGFGVVYRGTLCDGRMVAVKVLKDSKESNGEDFINEVASMSQTSHVNIVSLLGFCSEGSKRAIIYEFLGNGSLDKFISEKTPLSLDLTALHEIALGVARGLEYLHYRCKTRIVHFDIKPQNVLLDDNLCPKVSAFGLAKLCEKKESIMSLLDMRGTIGYISPEMISRVYGSVSHKSDVYSYGMLVLEMIGARKKERADQNSASNASSMYFPEWIYKDLEQRDNGSPTEDGISNEEDGIAKKMILVGLWCIQSSPLDRPPMNRVVEMMEGSLEALEVPPRPVLQQIPAAPLSESLWISEESSSASEVLISSTN